MTEKGKKDKRAKQERNLASNESAVVWQWVLPTSGNAQTGWGSPRGGKQSFCSLGTGGGWGGGTAKEAEKQRTMGERRAAHTVRHINKSLSEVDCKWLEHKEQQTEGNHWKRRTMTTLKKMSLHQVTRKINTVVRQLIAWTHFSVLSLAIPQSCLHSPSPIFLGPNPATLRYFHIPQKNGNFFSYCCGNENRREFQFDSVWGLNREMPSNRQESPEALLLVCLLAVCIPEPVTFKGLLRFNKPVLASNSCIRWPETIRQEESACGSALEEEGGVGRSGIGVLAAARQHTRWERSLGSLQTWVGPFRMASQWELNLADQNQ